MKESNAPNAKYNLHYYWSKFEDEHCLRNRIKKIYLFALWERFLVKILSNQKTLLEEFKGVSGK